MSSSTVNIFKNKIANLKKTTEQKNDNIIDNNSTNSKVADKTVDIEKKLIKVNIDHISPNPFQPRKVFEGIEELANSIQQKRLIQPISVIEISTGEYMLIAGERRLRAYKLLSEKDSSFKDIDAVVLDSGMTDSEKELLAALENIQRKNMTIIDTANLYANINKRGITYDEMVTTLGESKTSIARYIKISSLPNEIKDILNKSELNSTNKIELLTLINGNIEKQKELAYDIISNETFVKLEKKIRKVLGGGGDQNSKKTEVILSLYEQIKPTSKIITKANYRKLDNEQRTKVDELLNNIVEAQNEIINIVN